MALSICGRPILSAVQTKANTDLIKRQLGAYIMLAYTQPEQKRAQPEQKCSSAAFVANSSSHHSCMSSLSDVAIFRRNDPFVKYMDKIVSAADSHALHTL